MANITFTNSSGTRMTETSDNAIKAINQWWGDTDPARITNTKNRIAALKSANISVPIPTVYGSMTSHPGVALNKYAGFTPTGAGTVTLNQGTVTSNQVAPEITTPITPTARPAVTAPVIAPVNQAILGPITYTAGPTTTQPGEYGDETIPGERWAVRGNYRMKESSGNDLQQLVNGQWVPYTLDGGYDPSTGSNTVGSNERLRFVQGFLNAPDGTAMNTTGLQNQAIQAGWREPSHPNPNEGMGRAIGIVGGGMLGASGLLGDLLGTTATQGTSGLNALNSFDTGAMNSALEGTSGLNALNSFDTGAMNSALEGASGLNALNSFDTGAMNSALEGASGAPILPETPIDALRSTLATEVAAGRLTQAQMDAALGTMSGAGTGGLLSNLLDGLTGTNGTGVTNWMRMLGSLGSAGLGAYASNQQTNALKEQAQRYEGYGAPYRQRLSDLYANPDSFLTSNEVQQPVQQGTDMLMRSLSTQGNPFGSGNALQQGQSYASDQLFGRLGQEKDRLAGFGGLSSYNQAAPQASTNAINSTSNAWNAAGAGMNDIFNPLQTQTQTMAAWARAMRGGD